MFAPIEISGIGIHTGASTAVRISPAPKNHGTVFIRNGVAIPALPRNIDSNGRFSTRLTCRDQTVQTIEHLMAALVAVGVRDIYVDVDGPEVPILDGSAEPWAHALRACGVRGSWPFTPIDRTVEIVSGDAVAHLSPIPPSDAPIIDATVELSRGGFERQRRVFIPEPSAFEEILAARTFAFEDDVDEMRAAGFAQGGSLENALVLGGGKVLNPGGMRFADEPVRHKILDVVGDLALLGALPRARVRLHRPGHHLMHKVVQRLEQIGFPIH